MQRRLDNSNYRLRRKCSKVPEAHNQTHPLARMLAYNYTRARTRTIHVCTHCTISSHPIRSAMTYVELCMRLMRAAREFPTDRVSRPTAGKFEANTGEYRAERGNEGGKCRVVPGGTASNVRSYWRTSRE